MAKPDGRSKKKQPGLYPTKAVRVTAEERRYQMLQLTKGGFTEVEIAKTLDVSPSLVHEGVKKVLADMAAKAEGTANEVRALQMERYNTLLSKWWPLAMAGGNLDATEMVLKILAQISRINGVIPDAPLINVDARTMNVNGQVHSLRDIAKHILNGSGGPVDDDVEKPPSGPEADGGVS
tara:strand:- start:2411 stop:2947 length:537 start_codon:yes stop_codon:yes gene_type:complete